MSEEPLWYDALFRQKRKHGVFREVEAPLLEESVADTHTHLQMQRDPALALARAAAHKVSFLCTIVDPADDGYTTFDELERWQTCASEILREFSTPHEETESSFAFSEELASSKEPSVSSEEFALSEELSASHNASASHKAAASLEASVPDVRIALGCHPHNAKHYDEAFVSEMQRHLRDERVCAIGEVGLDYYYDLSPRETQREVFRQQIRLAHTCGLPLILHVRDAHDEAYQILAEEGWPESGVLLHCYNRDWEMLAPWVEAGCYVAFGGPLTFKRADEVRDSAVHVPHMRLLTETDAPYMTPEPLRGMLCEPAHVIFSAAKLAEVCGCAPGNERELFLRQLMENARGLLDRPATQWQMT